MSLADLGLSLAPLPRKSGGRRWGKYTTQENDAIRNMFRRNCTDKEIADVLERTPRALESQRHKLKLKRYRAYSGIGCRDCHAPPLSDPHATRCRRCYGKVAAGGSGSFYELFSMVSKEEILEGGVRRRLYGDLRGI